MESLSRGEFQRAVSLVRAGRLKEARTLLEALVQADRTDEQAWLWLSRAYTRADRRASVLQACLKANPGSRIARDELGRLAGGNTAEPEGSTAETLSYLQSVLDDSETSRSTVSETSQHHKSQTFHDVQAGETAKNSGAGNAHPGMKAAPPEGGRRPSWLILLLVAGILLGLLLIGGWFALRYLPGGYSLFPPTPLTLPTPSAGEWHELAPLEAGRAWQAAALLADGRVLLTGGVDDRQSLAVSRLYDRTTNTWQAAAPLAEGRDSHTLTGLGDGRALLVGGQNNDGLPLRSAWIYDPAADTWSESQPLTCHGSGHTATLLQDGWVLVAGGLCLEESRPVLAGSELFDPAAGTWSPTGNMLQLRNGHTASLLPDGRVMAAGGAGAEVYAGAEIYDPRTNAWQAAAPMATARTEQAAVTLAGGKVLVAGGVNAPPEVTATAELYDPQTGRWTSVADLPAPSLWGALAELPDGRALLAGGTADLGFEDVSAKAYYFVPEMMAWEPAPDLPDARALASAVDLPGGQVWLSGGKGTGGELLTGTVLYTPIPPAAAAVVTEASEEIQPTEPWRTPTVQLPPQEGAGYAGLWLSLPAPADLEEPLSLPAFSPDGSLLAAAGGRNSLGLWQVNEARKFRTLNAGQPLAGAGFSPNGRLVAGATRAGQLVVWDTLGGQELWLLEPGGVEAPYSLDWWAFSPDSSLLAAGYCTGGEGCSKRDFLHVWDMAAGGLRYMLEGQTKGAFSPDGRLLLTLSRSAPQDGLKVWEITTGELQSTIFARFKPGSSPLLAFNPDSSRLAFERRDGTPLAIWSVERGVPVLNMEEPLEDLAQLVYSADGGMLAADSLEGVTRVWDPMTGERISNFERGGLFSASLFSLRSGLLTARSADGRRVQAFDALSGRLLADFRGRPDWAAVFSPDGYTLAALGADGVVQVYHYGEPRRDYSSTATPEPVTTAISN